MAEIQIPFSLPYRSQRELENLDEALASGHLHGDGRFTAAARAQLLQIIPAHDALLTGSGTHALEMMSLLLDLGPGDEVIMPSFTFPSAATAVSLVGATPVFVDIDMSTGNIDPGSTEAAVTELTRAISVMHYGGVAVDINAFATIAANANVPLLEDNAHGIGATFRGRKLGTYGSLAAQSFHDTKNVHSGEGGSLLINDPDLLDRAEIVREKGTDRSRFLRGQVDKYTWVDLGSSYLMSELGAAVLSSQLADFDVIQRLRHEVWNRYHLELQDWASVTGTQLMHVPEGREHPAHLFYMLLPSSADRNALLAHLRERGVAATFHYNALDRSPGGIRYGRAADDCSNAHDFSGRLIRLPLWAGMSAAMVDQVIDAVQIFRGAGG